MTEKKKENKEGARGKINVETREKSSTIDFRRISLRRIISEIIVPVLNDGQRTLMAFVSRIPLVSLPCKQNWPRISVFSFSFFFSKPLPELS